MKDAEKRELDQAFAAYLKRKGVQGVHTQKHIDDFWTERKAVKKGYPAFLVDHPEYVDSEANRKKLTKWLDLYDLPATLENLTTAFNSIKTNLELQKIEPPPDPSKLEMRPGVWRNGRFIPDPNYVADVEVS
jgi:hypothetical protein